MIESATPQTLGELEGHPPNLVVVVRDNNHAVASLLFSNSPSEACTIRPAMLVGAAEVPILLLTTDTRIVVRFWKMQLPAFVASGPYLSRKSWESLLGCVENRGVFLQPPAHQVCAQLERRFYSVVTDPAF